jgi:cell division septation protein DedD
MVKVNRDATKVLAVAAIGLTLCGCTAFRQALGTAKNPPDEFTVLTKAPLVIPPDFNLRPPQPGAAARNEPDPDIQAREALFPQNAAAQVAALGVEYSEGEKFLLTRTNALAVDANVRRRVTADAGQEDLGPDFAQRLLNQPAGTPAQPAQMEAAAPPAQMEAAAPPPTPQQPAAAPAPAPAARPALAQALPPSPLPAPAPAASEPAANAPAAIVASAQPAAAPASINRSPERAVPPTVAASASAPTGGVFVLQIGAYNTERSAASALRALNGRSQALSQLEQGIQVVDLGAEGTLYRLQAGRFADRPSAANACEALKSEGVDCFVADPAFSQSPASGQASLSPGG